MSRPTTDKRGGMVAQFTTDCYRCGEPIVRGESHIVHVRGNAVHVECYGGQDE